MYRAGFHYFETRTGREDVGYKAEVNSSPNYAITPLTEIYIRPHKNKRSEGPIYPYESLPSGAHGGPRSLTNVIRSDPRAVGANPIHYRTWRLRILPPFLPYNLTYFPIGESIPSPYFWVRFFTLAFFLMNIFSA
jgi:hypothetical protein